MSRSNWRAGCAALALMVGLSGLAAAQGVDLRPYGVGADGAGGPLEETPALPAVEGQDAMTLDEIARLQAQINTMTLELDKRRLELELNELEAAEEVQRQEERTRRMQEEAAQAAAEAERARAEAAAAAARAAAEASVDGVDARTGVPQRRLSEGERLLMDGLPVVAEISGRGAALAAMLEMPGTGEIMMARAGRYLIDGLQVSRVEPNFVLLLVKDDRGEAIRSVRLDYMPTHLMP